MNVQHIVLIAGWLTYCALHSILANDRVKEKIVRFMRLSKANYRLLYNIFAFVSLGAMLYYQFSIPSTMLFYNSFLGMWAAPIITLTGLTGMIMCIVKYFRQLSGIREIQLDKVPILETTGMHKFVRHPLYISTFVFLIGLFFYKPLLSNLFAVVIIIVYTIIAIRFEEEKLIKEFGDQYEEYKRRVPMLIPFGKRGGDTDDSHKRGNADNADLTD